ncbi:CDP-diacylglycerol--glycerol-3-phosphate 3-phosphatidyltransferase [Fodinibius salinus]|uniref:CDP-diacylglycerol--glycerol-3-phosphate 3-phosphatidyltransferase n=1 Tax=Fodinibius salinus TaxID=860790 RepID=A0A5D3YJI9_9BACT|nr:CDP-alcohol phosphatidyltransferase family protein [Fodinibius salinus]TYP93678.1 CDP-diacylglycerol--glycerol-3-phosphate 3-phosphatidyltransferase [Fodinibius salinus]
MSETFNIDQQQFEVKQDLFTWSNLISFSRILVAFPIVWLHYTNGQQITWLITVLVLYGILSDYLDGYIARLTHRVTEWGKILDPVADKFCAFFLFLYAVYIDIIPLWFFLVEIGRDLFIVGGSLYIRKLRGKVAMAVMSGKISVNVLGLYWLSAFFFPDAYAAHQMLMGASLALMFFSFFDYLYRFNLILKGVEFN